MACENSIYSNEATDYIVGVFRGDEYVEQVYKPDCIIPLDDFQGVIFRQISTGENIRAAIRQFGFAAIPNLYGLMSDVDLEASGVQAIRRQPYLDLYGQGVLIGMVDTGIDFTHEAFVAADGTSRIVSIWDQTIEDGEGVPGIPYGREFTREQIDEALASEDPYMLVPSTDENGHGTFMAGVAAGNEMPERDFSGVAPLSELVVVKCKQAKRIYRDYYGIPEDVPAYQENDLMTAVKYLLDVARGQNKPIIICIGMGTNMGSHDGGGALSGFLERYNRVAGVCIMTCAGNEGNAGHHHLIDKKEDTINIAVSGNQPGFMCQIWWRTPGGLVFDLISPSGQLYSDIRAAKGEMMRFRFSPENTIIEVYFGVAQEQSREQVVVLQFENVKVGTWKILVKSEYDSPNFHSWLPIRQFLKEPVVFLDADPDTTINSLGTGLYTMMVSAYDTTEQSLYLQAGRGFTPTGYVKPIVVAPGVNVRGPIRGNRYGTMSGTSVATAFATGVAAMFMQQYEEEQLNGIGIREIFIRGAVPRGTPYPNTEWGFGVVDAERSIIGY